MSGISKKVGGNTVIVSGPQGCGKTRHAAMLAKLYGCQSIVDDWYPGMRTVSGALHLTHEPLSVPPPGVRLVQWEEVANAA
jgi:tRNA A37 N6-isopentenylltransferase MiaA